MRVARLAAGLAKARRPQAAAPAPPPPPPPRPASAAVAAAAAARPPPPPPPPTPPAAADAPAPPSQSQSADLARARELLPPADDGGSAAVAGVPAGWGPARLAAFLERTGVKPLGVDKAAGETRGVARFAGPADRARARQALADMGPAAASGLSLLLPLDPAPSPVSAAAAGKRPPTAATADAADAPRAAKAARPALAADAPTAARPPQPQRQAPGQAADVREAVCPWHAVPYGEQLRLKAATVHDALRRAAEGVRAIHDRRRAPPAGNVGGGGGGGGGGGVGSSGEAPLPAWLVAAAQRPGGAAAPFPAIVRAPQLEGYRSKSEFSVGLDLGGRPAVGFLHGSFRDGVTAVGDASRCRHTSAAARGYAALLQRFLRGDGAGAVGGVGGVGGGGGAAAPAAAAFATGGAASALEAWDKTSNSGFWRMLLVREGRAATFLPLPLPAGGEAAPAATNANANATVAPARLADVPLERWLVRLPEAQFGGGDAAEGDAEHPAVAAFQALLRADGPAAALEQVPPLLEPAAAAAAGREAEGGAAAEATAAAAAAPGATNAAEPRAPPPDEVMIAIQVNPLYVKNRTAAGERAALAAAAARELRALAAAFFAAAATPAAPSSSPSLPAPTSLLVQYHFGVSNAAPANAPLMPLEKAAADFDAIAAGRDDDDDKADKDAGATAAAAAPPPANALPGAPPLASGPGSCADDPQCLHESLCDLRFRISPAAFFQVNAPSTCLLYRLVGDFAAASAAPASDAAAPDAAAAADSPAADGAAPAAPAAAAAPPSCQLLLDVCCGTGTIGVSLSDRAARVYGVDSSAPAIEDARRNAAANAGSAGRCEFVCATAESALPPLLRERGVSSLSPGSVVAVADPPRAGLHKNVLRALLAASPTVRRLVLVSCNPASLADNLVELCRPPWSRARGEAREGAAFRPVLAVAVDLFPHTRHVEAVVLLER